MAAPAVLAMEACGSGQDSFPVEIGFVLPDGQSYSILIRPAAAWTQRYADAALIHAVLLQTLLAHGRGAAEVATQLNERLHGLTLYCDRWEPASVWLQMLFEAAGLIPSFRLDNLRELLTEREAAFWDILKTQVTTEMRLQRRRASSEAKSAQRTLMRLRAPLPDPPNR